MFKNKWQAYLGYFLVLFLAALVAFLVGRQPSFVFVYSIQPPQGATTRLGRGAITSIGVSPDNRYLAIGSAIGIYVYDAQTFEEVWHHVTDSRVFSLGFTQDRRLLTGHPDARRITVWDSVTGQQLATLAADPGWASNLNISPDGYLLAAQINGPVAVWDLNTLHSIRELPVQTGSVRLSPSGKLLSACGGNGCVIYDATTGQDLYQMGSISGDFTWLSGNLALVLSSDGWRIWDGDNNQMQDPIALQGVAPHVLSPDGNLISAGQDYGKLVLWNIEEGKVESVLNADSTALTSAVWMPDGRTIITANEGEVIAWDVASSRRLRTIAGFMDAAFDVQWSPDGSHIGVGTRDGRLLLLDPHSGSNQFVSTVGHEPVFGLAFSPDGERIATTSGYSLSVLARANHRAPITWGTDDMSLIVRWSPDGKRLATGDLSGLITLWDAHTSAKLHQSRKPSIPMTDKNPANDHTDRVGNIAWSPDSRFLASADSSKLIIWDAASLTPVHSILTFSEYGIDIRFEGVAIAWSPDSKRIVTASRAGLTFWDVGTGTMLDTWPGPAQTNYDAVDWAPNGQLIAAAGFDGQIDIWDSQSGKLLRSLDGHKLPIKRVTWSPDSKMLASGCWDGTVIIWDTKEIR